MSPNQKGALALVLAMAVLILNDGMMKLARRDIAIGEAFAVAPFRYSLPIWSALTGYLLFGTLPDRWFFVGGTLIVGSRLYVLCRETVLKRDLSIRSTPPG